MTRRARRATPDTMPEAYTPIREVAREWRDRLSQGVGGDDTRDGTPDESRGNTPSGGADA